MKPLHAVNISTDRIQSMGEDNVFTGISLFTEGGDGIEGVSARQGVSGQTHTPGRYASLFRLHHDTIILNLYIDCVYYKNGSHFSRPTKFQVFPG